MVIMLVMPLLAAFAVYRIATDLAWESGPFGVFAAMRGFVMVRAAAWAGEGVTCPICWSFWLSLPAGLLISPNVFGLVYWLAIAGAVALAVRATSHDD